MANSKKSSKEATDNDKKVAKTTATAATKKVTKEKSPKDKKSFGKDFKAELKKVTWPTPKQLVNNTTAVVVIVIITAAIVFALDVVFENINKYGVEGLKKVVQDTTVEQTAEPSTETTENEVVVDDSTANETTEQPTTETSTETTEEAE